MAKRSASTVGGGIGFGSLLAVLFIGLRLTHHINWSWWWVLSPLWLPTAVVLAGLLMVLLFVFAVYVVGVIVAALL